MAASSSTPVPNRFSTFKRSRENEAMSSNLKKIAQPGQRLNGLEFPVFVTKIERSWRKLQDGTLIYTYQGKDKDNNPVPKELPYNIYGVPILPFIGITPSSSVRFGNDPFSLIITDSNQQTDQIFSNSYLKMSLFKPPDEIPTLPAWFIVKGFRFQLKSSPDYPGLLFPNYMISGLTIWKEGPQLDEMHAICTELYSRAKLGFDVIPPSFFLSSTQFERPDLRAYLKGGRYVVLPIVNSEYTYEEPDRLLRVEPDITPFKISAKQDGTPFTKKAEKQTTEDPRVHFSNVNTLQEFCLIEGDKLVHAIISATGPGKSFQTAVSIYNPDDICVVNNSLKHAGFTLFGTVDEAVTKVSPWIISPTASPRDPSTTIQSFIMNSWHTFANAVDFTFAGGLPVTSKFAKQELYRRFGIEMAEQGKNLPPSFVMNSNTITISQCIPYFPDGKTKTLFEWYDKTNSLAVNSKYVMENVFESNKINALSSETAPMFLFFALTNAKFTPKLYEHPTYQSAFHHQQELKKLLNNEDCSLRASHIEAIEAARDFFDTELTKAVSNASEYFEPVDKIRIVVFAVSKQGVLRSDFDLTPYIGENFKNISSLCSSSSSSSLSISSSSSSSSSTSSSSSSSLSDDSTTPPVVIPDVLKEATPPLEESSYSTSSSSSSSSAVDLFESDHESDPELKVVRPRVNKKQRTQKK